MCLVSCRGESLSWSICTAAYTLRVDPHTDGMIISEPIYHGIVSNTALGEDLKTNAVMLVGVCVSLNKTSMSVLCLGGPAGHPQRCKIWLVWASFIPSILSPWLIPISCYRTTVIDGLSCQCFVWPIPVYMISASETSLVVLIRCTCVPVAPFAWMCLNTICIRLVSFHLQCELHKRGFDMNPPSPPSVYHVCNVCVLCFDLCFREA